MATLESDCLTAADANRKYYKSTAKLYDGVEQCMVSSHQQAMMEKDLFDILNKNPYPSNQLRILDACGGTGNASLKLLARKVPVTLCDISPELIEIFKAKCAHQGFVGYEVICENIITFFKNTDLKFDLIIFSSCLHHLEDYTSVLKLAANCLNHGGYIYTTFDPIRGTRKFPIAQLRWLDWLFYRFFNNPERILVGIKRRLKRKSVASNYVTIDSSCGKLAEYHAANGIDDFSLITSLELSGYNIVWHKRFVTTRTTIIRYALRLLGKQTTFKILLRKA